MSFNFPRFFFFNPRALWQVDMEKNTYSLIYSFIKLILIDHPALFNIGYATVKKNVYALELLTA